MTQNEIKYFIKQIQNCSYAEKYRRWTEYLEKQQHSQSYLLLLGHFLQLFPFNNKYWIEYIRLTKFQQYETALRRNPKSYQIWQQYLLNCRLLYYENDKEKYKRLLQLAMSEIGADPRALHIFQDYYGLIKNNFVYDFFKKLFMRALIGLQKMYQKFIEWFNNLPQQQLKILAVRQFKYKANAMQIQHIKKQLLKNITQVYQKTLSYREKRLKLQTQIKYHIFNGTPQNKAERQKWNQLIQLQRNNGVVQNISYCYQRSLMAQTDDRDLWQQAFHYLQNQTNKYIKVLAILRNNKQFFISFDISLYFYWCDLEERQNPNIARNMLHQLLKIYPSFEAYQRLIMFEIRGSNFVKAKQLYEHLLTIYQTDIETLSYVILQFADFYIKYFKDHNSVNQLYKGYLMRLPYNNLLFTRYLSFVKYFQKDQGYYDQLVSILSLVIVKAKQACHQQQFINVTKLIKYHLRQTLQSIYLIKLTQQRLQQIQEKTTKI